MYRYLSFTLLGLMMAGVAAAGTATWQGPSLIATQIDSHKGDPQSREQGKIHISKEGMRGEFGGAAGRTMIIINFKSGKCWYVAEKQKIYTEGKINPKTGDCPSPFAPPGLADAETVSGLMASEPCEGYARKQQQGADTVAGRKARKWLCTGKRGEAAMHWYDSSLKIVIKEATAEGEMSELRDIKQASFSSSLLQQPKGYRRVSGPEFMQKLMAGAMR